MHKPKSIDEYIALFLPEIQDRLMLMRTTIQEAAPEAVEVISYSMPAFKQKKVLVYFAAYEHHIGFYPTSKPIEVFKDKLKDYKHSKGAIQFPHSEEIPVNLVREIVEYRVKAILGN